MPSIHAFHFKCPCLLIFFYANEIFRTTQEQSLSQSFISICLLIKKGDMFLKVYLLICIPSYILLLTSAVPKGPLNGDIRLDGLANH